MDYWAAIRELYVEKERLDRAIATIEALAPGGGLGDTSSRRGRKTMPVEERKTVSERMKSYWAKRRGDLKAKKP
jgi:hypothetical protein